MPPLAVRPGLEPGRLDLRNHPSKCVLLVSDRFEMIWVHTQSISAEVVQNKALWNRTVSLLIDPAVGEFLLSSPRQDRVAPSPRTLDRGPFPEPAPARLLLDQLEEPLVHHSPAKFLNSSTRSCGGWRPEMIVKTLMETAPLLS